MYPRAIIAAMLAVSFLLWIAYQMVIRKKKFSEISGDLMAIVFFIAIWGVIVYLSSL